MGLAASQARMLLLTARRSDLEYRAQCLTQRKMTLSQQTEQLAKDYSAKISNRTLRFVYNMNGNNGQTQTDDLTYDCLGEGNPNFVGDYRVINAEGAIVVPSVDDIPMAKVKVPLYAIVDTTGTSDDAYKYIEDSKDVYTDATSDQIGEKKSLYMKGYIDNKGTVGYVQIQNNDGSAIENAKIYQASTDTEGNTVYASVSVFRKDENDEYVLNDNVKNSIYTKSVSTSYRTTTDTSETLPAGQQYVQVGYEYKEVPREQGADGCYTSDDGRKYVVCEAILNKNYFQNGLRNGAFVLQQSHVVQQTADDGFTITDEKTTWNTTPWQGIDVVQDVLYTEDDALAESEYEAKTAVIKSQDQMLDMEIQQIQAQHKAIEAEIDSVKKVRDDNIDKTFKIFA